jgi:orotate phosphoribosyltransferase
MVLLFEDLVNQGSSLVDSMQGLKAAELNCVSCLCVVDYQMQSAQIKITELGMKLLSLTDFASLIKGAFELNLIDQDGLNLLKEWHTDPKAWSARF